MPAYVDRLIAETEGFVSREVDSIYFGGGTPTTLSPALLKKLLYGIKKQFPCSGEITIEANPATVSKEKLQQIRKAGFNRISIGVQSLQDDELKALGRLHSSEEAVECILDAASAGFSNISADVIFGHPCQTVDSVGKTVKALTALPITHISTYSLSIEENTPFDKAGLIPADEDTERQMYHNLRHIVLESGFCHYEISNFARSGFEAVHNSIYWTGGEYVGLGAGAHGYLDGVRYQNIENVQKYIATSNPVVSKTTLTNEDLKEEKYMLGLRMLKGIPIDRNPKIPKLIEEGLLETADGNIRLTEKGLDIANYVIVELCT